MQIWTSSGKKILIAQLKWIIQIIPRNLEITPGYDKVFDLQF